MNWGPFYSNPEFEIEFGVRVERPQFAFSTEFAKIGIVAGLVGSVLGTALSVILISRLLDTPYQFSWLPAIVATLITAALTVSAGWLASYGVLSQKPLDILRNVE